jgi:hypothetical protein
VMSSVSSVFVIIITRSPAVKGLRTVCESPALPTPITSSSTSSAMSVTSLWWPL